MDETHPEQWEQIKELVFECQTQEPADLDAWLNERCPTEDVRREVEKLVRTVTHVGDFLEGTASEKFFGVRRQHPIRIGKYRILEELGSGGLGVVYAAYDENLERRVAIKVLQSRAVDDPEKRKRLLWDAKAAGSLQHPNIVVIHDIGLNEEGRDFISMELVAGNTLAHLIAQQALTAANILNYATQVARGLEAAHADGLVHRDLKPSNIMVTPEGVVKILDFGLAKAREGAFEAEGAPLTIEGRFAGTVAYVSPEQAEGRAVDARSDIFSFGCVLFEMLTGQQAFQGGSPLSVLAGILHSEPPNLRDLNPRVDQAFDEIVRVCLQKDPALRFQTVREVRERLEQMAGDTTVLLPQIRVARKRRGIHWILAATAAAAGLLVGGAAVWILKPEPRRSIRSRTRLTSDVGISGFPAISNDGKLMAFASDRGGRGNLDLWVQQVGSQPLAITSHTADDYDPVFSPDGLRIVFRSDRDGGGLYIIPALGTGTEHLIAKDGRDPQFSPDGQYIAYWVGETGASLFPGSAAIFVLPAAGGIPKKFQPQFGSAAYPVWSPSGDHILFLGRQSGDSDSKPRWWIGSPRDTGVKPTAALEAFETARINRPFGEFYSTPFAWLPINNLVLFTATNGGSTNIWGIRMDEQGNILDTPRPYTEGTGIETRPAATASREILKIAYEARTVRNRVWRLPLNNRGAAAGPPDYLVTSYPELYSPSLSRDGSTLTFVTKQTGAFTIHAFDTRSRTDREVTSFRTMGPVMQVLSGDGSTIAYYVDKSGFRVPVVTGGATEQLCERCGQITDLSEDGLDTVFESAGPPEELMISSNRKPSRSLLHVKDAPGMRQSSGRLSPDKHWLAFCALQPGSYIRQIMIAPVSADGVVEARQLVPLTDGPADREPAWSPDGKRVYFLSRRDGFWCVWARTVDGVTGRPAGALESVAHFHHAREGILNPPANPGGPGLSVSRNSLVVTVAEVSSNVWLQNEKLQ